MVSAYTYKQTRYDKSREQRVTCPTSGTRQLPSGPAGPNRYISAQLCRMFKFTFNSGGDISNPFVAKAEEQEPIQSVAPQTITRKLPAPPKRPLPPPSVAHDVQQPSRKRGWAPTSSSASAAASQPTLTNGWIDTPSRYLEAASQSHRGVGEDEAVDAGK